MIRINSFLHRHALADIIGRWMIDRLEAGDVRVLKELISYNGHLAGIILDEVATTLFSQLAGGEVKSMPVTRKGMLKDFLVDHPPCTNQRTEEMFRRYRKYPQDFYRETPFDGRLYYVPDHEDPWILGTSRRKRFKRVAEKSSRRIIDFVFGQIKGEAEKLARERAESMGIPLDRLVTPTEKQKEEFAHAERRVVKRIRTGEFLEDVPLLDINDVFGIKAFCEDSEVARLTGIIENHPRMKVLEYELHSGSYNALNIALQYQIDKTALAAEPPVGEVLEKFGDRGLTAGEVRKGYARFVEEAEDDLIVELIVTSYQEALESEIGRSMHEERVLAQRDDQQYRGSLALNIAALLEYMLALRRYRENDIAEIPIKLWIKYMPDYFEMVMKEMYGVTETIFLGHD